MSAEILTLQEALNSAREFENFENVYMTVTLHPEWLTEIPAGRKWAILHHVIYSGDIDHLYQLLALQKLNPAFRLLTLTNDKQTVLDVAKLRAHDVPKMLEHIQRLIKLDEMLNNAKDLEWDKCYDIVKENPVYANEKPPYRRFYLIHHMACVNELKQFERFRKIPNFRFDLTLRADKKKINAIAREYGGHDFANYIEKEFPAHFANDENDDKYYEPSEKAKQHTENINIIMEHRSVFYESDLSIGPTINIKTRVQVDKEVEQKYPKPKPKLSNPSRNDSNKPNAEHSMEEIRNILNCSLTGAIVTEPVVAADGFTYEHSAIQNWLEGHDYSPMTNEKFAHKKLSPNMVVKQILNALQPQKK